MLRLMVPSMTTNCRDGTALNLGTRAANLQTLRLERGLIRPIATIAWLGCDAPQLCALALHRHFRLSGEAGADPLRKFAAGIHSWHEAGMDVRKARLLLRVHDGRRRVTQLGRTSSSTSTFWAHRA